MTKPPVITMPRMILQKLDPTNVFNALHVVDTTNMGLPTNYYQLTPDQRAFIDEITNICENSFQEQIDDYNLDLVETEIEIDETISELESKVYDKYEDE